jgi:protein-S-isoprenylcysteine O-methyltransferase Ste14
MTIYWVSLSACAVTAGCFLWALLFFFVPSREGSWPRRVLMASIAACALLHFVVIVQTREVPAASRVGGLVLLLLAHLLFWWSLAVHRRAPPGIAFSDALPRSLITEGPYRLVRHPFYVSYLLAWSAGACIAASAYLALTVVWMFGLYYLAASREEGVLLASDGHHARYRAYRRRTGMFLPKWFTPRCAPPTAA